MNLLRRLAVFAAMGIGAGCAGPPAPEADVAAVRAAVNDLRVAVNAGDTAAFIRLTADDFEVFPPGTKPLNGEAARDLFRQLFAESSPSLDPFTDEQIEVSGNLGMQRYSFRLTLRPKAGGTATTEVGSGLHIWRRGTDGRWRLAKDIYTSPAAPGGS